MAAVTYTDGTEYVIYAGDMKIVTWKSPSTMDSADTVILPTPPTGRTVVLDGSATAGAGGVYDSTSQDMVTATISTLTVTIDAAGGTTDHVYFLTYKVV